MAIDWTRPLCTKHDTPFIGRVIDPCPASGKRRVATVSPSLLAKHFVPAGDAATTVWRCDEDGSVRGGAGESLHDFVNYDPDDGVVRIQLSGAEVASYGRAAA